MANRTRLEAFEVKSSKNKTKPSVSNPSASNITRKTSKPNSSARSKKTDYENSFLELEHGLPDFENEYRQIAYGRFMRSMLEECLLDEKIEREETEMDLQMAHLADRFQKTMDQLDKTNGRLKDISFIVEQKRLLDLKSNDSAQFYKITEESNAGTLLKDLSNAEEVCLNKIELKNVDFGYDKNSGHKQLLDAVNDAIEGLEKIKKESNLDVSKFTEYDRSKQSLEELEKHRFDVERLKLECEAKLPKLSEIVMLEASKNIAKLIENDDKDD